MECQKIPVRYSCRTFPHLAACRIAPSDGSTSSTTVRDLNGVEDEQAGSGGLHFYFPNPRHIAGPPSFGPSGNLDVGNLAEADVETCMDASRGRLETPRIVIETRSIALDLSFMAVFACGARTIPFVAPRTISADETGTAKKGTRMKTTGLQIIRRALLFAVLVSPSLRSDHAPGAGHMPARFPFRVAPWFRGRKNAGWTACLPMGSVEEDPQSYDEGEPSPPPFSAEEFSALIEWEKANAQQEEEKSPSERPHLSRIEAGCVEIHARRSERSSTDVPGIVSSVARRADTDRLDRQFPRHIPRIFRRPASHRSVTQKE